VATVLMMFLRINCPRQGQGRSTTWRFLATWCD